jgi:hypothetical protein
MIEMDENGGGAASSAAIYSITFVYPLNELLKYAKDNPVTLYKRGRCGGAKRSARSGERLSIWKRKTPLSTD